jgi:predicted P-loop ATPase
MITKEELLTKTTEEQIIKFYVPEFNSKNTKNYRSIFTDKDDNPSLNFYKEGNIWKFKSHNSDHQGDVFQLVAYIEGFECKSEFTKVLQRINENLNLGLNSNFSKNVKLEAQPYSNLFIKYWKQFGVKEDYLIKYKVQQVLAHEFITAKGKRCKFDYNKLNQIAVCYKINERIKIYLPEIDENFTDQIGFKPQKKNFGFKDQTNADVFGLDQLPSGKLDYIIIAAGEKDCLVANSHDFPAISLQSENQLPQSALIEFLKKKTNNILCCYDNDEPGKNASAKLQKTFGILPIHLPEAIKDTAIYFKKFSTEDFKNLISSTIQQTELIEKQKKIETTGKTIFHQTEEYLNAFYHFRYNTIKQEIEYSTIGKYDFKPINENSLYLELQKKGIKISQNNLIAILKSDFIPTYNPLQYYFTNLKEWKEGDQDYILELANHVKATEQEQFNTQLKKWLCRTVACALDDNLYNKQAFILVHAQQNSGKSSFCRFLCPPSLSDYIAEDITDDKDSRILLCKNFLINLDELSSLARKEINSLKALFSKDKINERLPYDRKNSIISRVCSFIGSTNMAEFLTDETGSVRWLCFNIEFINWDYRKNINIDDVWSQAYFLWKNGNFNYNMTTKEIEENEKRNSSFQVLSTEAELIPKFFDLPSSELDVYSEFMTSTDVLLLMQNKVNVRLNKISIGKALLQNGFKRIKDNKSQRYGYYVVKNLNTLLGITDQQKENYLESISNNIAPF